MPPRAKGPPGLCFFQSLGYGGHALSLELEFGPCLFQMKCIMFRARKLSELMCANLILGVRTLCAACELRDLVRLGTQDCHNLCETLCVQYGTRA